MKSYRNALASAAIIALTVPSALSAQTMTQTLPDGVLSSGGTGSSGRGSAYPFDLGAIQYQEVHSSWVGKGARVLKGMAFRRGAGLASNSTAVARTATVTIMLGEGKRSRFTSASFRGNFINIPSLVLPRTKVNLPSWENKPATSPAPFDLVFPFKYSYAYRDGYDFIWDFKYEGPSITTATHYYADRQKATYVSSGYTNSGTGCTVTGRTRPYNLKAYLLNWGPLSLPVTMETILQVTDSPRVTPSRVALGIRSQNLAITGWCAPIYVDPLVFVHLSHPTTTGTATTKLPIQYNTALFGLKFHAQAFVSDPGLPAGLALSNRSSFTIPTRDPGGTPLTWKYISATGGYTTPRGPYTTGSVITGWY